MNIITGRRGQPHITSQQHRDTNTAIFGSESCVLNVGKHLCAERINANTIKISDGQVSVQGCIASIEANEYENVTIENGKIGKQRYDLIAAHYFAVDDGTGQYIEDVVLNVIKGDEVNYSEETIMIPVTPSVADSKSIRDGAIEFDFPLYQVHIQELDIVDIKPLFNIANYDTGWMPISFSSNFTDFEKDSQNLKCRRIGNDVEIRGDITPTKRLDFSNSSAEYTIGYISEDCAPSDEIRELCQGPGRYEWLFVVKTTGELTASRCREGGTPKDMDVSHWIPLHTRYFVD